jgi:adenosine deaminase
MHDPTPLTRAVPKIELHAHLIGSISAETYLEFGQKYGASFSTDDPKQLFFYDSMPSFLALYESIASYIRTPEDWSEIVYRSLREEWEASGLRYREIFFSPTVFVDIPYRDMVDGLVDGIDRANAEFGVDGRLIASIFRNQGGEIAERMVDDVLASPHPYVVGIGIDGDENVGPAADFEKAYWTAREGGLRTTAHAGERNGPQEVRHALHELCVDRIDHGYGIVFDRALIEEARERDIHFAATWLSSISHYPRDPRLNPLCDMLRMGLNVSISTDDRSMVFSTLMQDLEQVADAFSVSDATLVRQNSAALEAAWMPEPLRQRIRNEIETALVEARSQAYDQGMSERIG